MKRSEYIILGAAGLIIVAAFWPKSETPEEAAGALVFSSLAECKTSGKMTLAECDTEWSKAEKQQVAAAPKFEDIKYCETTYGAGNCNKTTVNGVSAFVPAMVGFMVARQLGAGGPVTQPLYPGSQQQPCPPGADASQRPDCAAANRSSSSGGSSGTSSGTSSRSSGSTSGTSSKSYRTGNGQVVVPFSGGSGRVSAPSSTSSSGSGTTSRGGFGSTSSSYSSGG